MQEIWNNPRYRYGIYMEAIEKLQLSGITKELVLDWFLRLAKECERKNGAGAMDYDLQMRMDEVRQGKYGMEQQECFLKMSAQCQRQAARYMLLQEQSGESLMLYGKALTGILEDGVLYRKRREKSRLLFYLGKARNVKDEAVIEFVNREFLPFGFTVHVYWKKSFGIIGDDRCMDLNEILLF